MIQLTCAKCKTLLEIDDAFAGGVCRCQYCGAIQTVPKHLPKSAGLPQPAPPPPGRPTPKPPGPKIQMPTPAAAPPPEPAGEDLERLAQLGAPAAPTAPPGVLEDQSAVGVRPGVPIAMLIAVAAAMLIVGLVIGWSIGRYAKNRLKDVPTSDAALAGGVVTPADSAVSVASPKASFMGQSIKGPSVIYLLDRGSETIDTFDLMKAATINSLQSLGDKVKFQVIFWETDKIVAYPPDALRYATEREVVGCRELMSGVPALGKSNVEPALAKALTQNPAEIVLATGKASLDESFATVVIDVRKNTPARIHTFALGGSTGTHAPLQAIAQKTGGAFHVVDYDALRAFAE